MPLFRPAHRYAPWRSAAVAAPLLLAACPPQPTVPLQTSALPPPIMSVTGSQQECPGPGAPPGESWVQTETEGPKTGPAQQQTTFFELNATHAGTGSLLLTATATDPKAGIANVTLFMNVTGCSFVNDAWNQTGQQSGVAIATFTGTETGSSPNQQANESGTASITFDVSNYLNGACSGTCTAGSGVAARSTVNASGTPCCAPELQADQVDFEFWATASNFTGGSGTTQVIQYVGYSATGLQGNHPGACNGAWIGGPPPHAAVSQVPVCTGH